MLITEVIISQGVDVWVGVCTPRVSKRYTIL